MFQKLPGDWIWLLPWIAGWFCQTLSHHLVFWTTSRERTKAKRIALRWKVGKEGRRLCASVACNFLLHSRMQGWNTARLSCRPHSTSRGVPRGSTGPEVPASFQTLYDTPFQRPFLSIHSSSRCAQLTPSCSKTSKKTFKFPASHLVAETQGYTSQTGNSNVNWRYVRICKLHKFHSTLQVLGFYRVLQSI